MRVAVDLETGNWRREASLEAPEGTSAVMNDDRHPAGPTATDHGHAERRIQFPAPSDTHATARRSGQDPHGRHREVAAAGVPLGLRRDDCLVEGVRAGCCDSLAEIFRRHGRAVHTAARGVIGAAGADDVSQEVFVRFWASPNRFDPERGSLRTFLRLQARNRAVDLHRTESARRARELLDNGTKVREPHRSTEEEVLADLEHSTTWAMLDTINPDLRDAIALAFFDDRTYKEVAAQGARGDDQVTDTHRPAPAPDSSRQRRILISR